MKRLFRLMSVFIFCAVAIASSVSAQAIKLPAHCIRISTIEELSPTDCFVIAGSGIFTSTDQFALLSNNSYASGLKGVETSEPDMLEIGTREERCIWRIVPQGENGRFVLQNVADSRYLYAPKPAETGLTVNKTKQTVWEITAADELFTFRNVDSPNRYLGFYTGTTPKFGHYTDTEIVRLKIYKIDSRLSGKKGSVILPADGTTVTLHADSFLRDTDGTPQPAEEYITSAGTVAPDGNWQTWTLKFTSDSAAFVLKSPDDTYLGYDLNANTVPQKWRLSNGHIVTDETPQRYLCFNGTFTVCPAENTENASDVTLLTLGAEAGSTTSGAVKKLSGTWSAHRLSGISWNNVIAVDASNIRLPKRLQPFCNRPAAENTILYIDARDSALVPQDWPFVVACREDEKDNLLIRPAVLHDRQPLTVDRNITHPAGAITYLRDIPADGLWNTLCLPFSATVPDDFKAERLIKIEDGLLIFEPVYEIPAGQPVIIRAADENETTLSLIADKAGFILPAPEETAACLKGTYSGIKVTNDTDTFYFLNETGESFTRATRGSSLAPFRAYLTLPSTKAAFSIRHSALPTGIGHTPDNRPKSNQACFKLNGTRADKISEPVRENKLPAGIYIINGKKVLIQQQ